jgi:MoaA/NifB/PqqE/SkfB family radical SAM enzyme
MKRNVTWTGMPGSLCRIEDGYERVKGVKGLADVSVIKDYAIKKTINGLIFVLPNIPDDKLLTFAEKFVSGIRWPEGQEFIRSLILQIKNRLPELHKNTRRGAINFLTEALFNKARVRDAYYREHGHSPPLLLVISPTMRCNLKCEGCYAGMYAKEDDLPEDVFDRVLTEAKEMGIYFIVVSGGEPFLYKPLLDIFRKHDDVTFQVYTNGTLIDRDLARTIAESGNVIPCISVEGYEDETDARRGEGVYSKVIQAMDNLKEAKALYGFSATVTRFNSDMLTSEGFVDYYMEEKGCFIGWYFQYMPIGTRPSLELMTTPEQRIQRMERINRMRDERKALISDFWCDGPLVGGCLAAGRRYLHINHNGDVEPCVFVHFAADNIKEKSLAETLESDFFRSIRERAPYHPNLLRPCMIIDHPYVLRECVAKCGARPTHPEAEGVITELARDLDAYGEEYGGLADPIWAEKYQETALELEQSDTA